MRCYRLELVGGTVDGDVDALGRFEAIAMVHALGEIH